MSDYICSNCEAGGCAQYDALTAPLKAELAMVRKQHGEDHGRWDEQHTHQHAVNAALYETNLRLTAKIKELETPLCIGEATIRLLAKEGQHVFDSGHALIAADDLFKKDPYERFFLSWRGLGK